MRRAAARAARNFAIALACVVLVCGAGFGFVGWTLGPPVGDLTRIGGLSERLYGSQQEQSGFETSSVHMLRYDELLMDKRHGSILVFGDSFSAKHERNITWTEVVHAQTGREIDLVAIEGLDKIVRYFRSSAYIENPPEAVIVEMGERTVFRRAQPLMDRADCRQPDDPHLIESRPKHVPRQSWRQRTAFRSFDEQMSWGGLAARFRLFKKSRTIELPLKTNTLFSNRRSDSLLIYDSDIIRHSADALAPRTSTQVARESVCAIRSMLSAANNLAPVYITVAPDKRSVYSKWIDKELPEKAVDFLDVLNRGLGKRYIDLYAPLLQAVENGQRDIYFPNDTHWSSKGHGLVGDVVARAISKKR